MKINIDEIIPNPEQPRKHFPEKKLQELADSIFVNDLLQPIVVEQGADSYILLDGERRLRACRMLGMTEIEAFIRPPKNGNSAIERTILALVSNLQRADLDPIEEANAYQKLRNLGETNNQIAIRMGTNLTRIANRLDLLTLDEEIQEMIASGDLPISAFVIDAIKGVPEERRLEFCRKVASIPGMPNRAIEKAAKRLNQAIQAEKIDIRVDPAMHLAQEKSGAPNPTRWDALHQLGKIPPWEKVSEAARYTCRHCNLRQEASKMICGQCPAVDLLSDLIKASHDR